MTPKVVLLAAFAVTSVLAVSPTYQAPATFYRAHYPLYKAPTTSTTPATNALVSYNFNYAVMDDNSGNNFGHQEARDGSDTRGFFYVQLPDGHLQKVTYSVNGDSGFVAEVVS